MCKSLSLRVEWSDSDREQMQPRGQTPKNPQSNFDADRNAHWLPFDLTLTVVGFLDSTCLQLVMEVMMTFLLPSLGFQAVPLGVCVATHSHPLRFLLQYPHRMKVRSSDPSLQQGTTADLDTALTVSTLPGSDKAKVVNKIH